MSLLFFHLSFLRPYIESIWFSFSFVFSDVFASPIWAELNDVKAPSLRCLAEKLPEKLQASTSPAPVQNAFYSIHWAHDIAGFDSPTNHTLPQKVLESAKRRLSHVTSKKAPHDTRNFTKVVSESRWIFGGHKIHGHGVIGICGVLKIS